MKKTTTNKAALAVGAGLAAATAAAAGYYFYGSSKAKSHRKIVAKWATDMKKEVQREVSMLKKASPKTVAGVVDRVAKTYAAAKSVDIVELNRAAKELKNNWDMLEKEARRIVGATRTSARKSVTKAKGAQTAVKKSLAQAAKKVTKKRSR